MDPVPQIPEDQQSLGHFAPPLPQIASNLRFGEILYMYVPWTIPGTPGVFRSNIQFELMNIATEVMKFAMF